MGDPELIVITHNPQKMVSNLQGRSVILDAHCVLVEGREIDIEVQKANDDNHQKRVRYNGAVLTANITEPGTKFEKVPDVCVIFISRFDMFKDGLSLYHVDRVIRENGRVVDNGFEEIYVNAAVNDGTDVAELMEVFISENVYNNEKFPLTSAGKHRYRETEEGQNVMCEIVEKIKLEAKQEGRAEERYSAITKLLNNNFDEETIIALGYTLDEIKAAEKDKQKES
ncbi:conserved hypothetical protein (putative transposase or invertase) [Lachnospiraceae bacterium]|nr:conserved hypothetical protein (putative transposase or invertase) [Lachnospiraceae bacterium]